MALTLVGSETWTGTLVSPGNTYDTIPLPSGTVVGDMIVFVGSATSSISPPGITPQASNFPVDIPDARLAQASADDTNLAVWVGEATDLSDVPVRLDELDYGGAVAAVIVFTLRNVDDVAWDFLGDFEGTYAYIPPPNDHVTASAGGAAVAFVADKGPDGDVAVGASGVWDNIDVAGITNGTVEVSLRAFMHPTSDVGDDLDVTFGADTTERYIGWWLDIDLSTPVVETTRPWLRQRQSPKANVRVSVNRPQLRARQRFL